MKKKYEPNAAVLRIRRLIAILGLILVLVGEYIIFSTTVLSDAFPPLSVYILCGLGVALFVAGMLVRPGHALQSLAERLSLPGSAGWILAAVILSLLSVFSMSLFQKVSYPNYFPAVVTWLAAGVCFVIAFRQDLFVGVNWRDRIREHRTELILVGILTLLAAVLRFYQLGALPRVIDGDEGLMGLAAQSTIAGEYANPFALWENFGALYLQMINVLFRFFGVTPFALRFMPAISGILAVPALYLLARQIAGKRVALIAAAMLAVSHTHIHFSRIASVGYIHATWLIPLELFLLLSGLEKRSSWRTAAGGVLLAIHFSIYLTSQVVVGLGLVFMLLAFFFLRKWFKPALRPALAFWGGFLIMVLPELFYITQNKNAFFDRLSQNGTFQTGWLAQTVASTGHSAIQVLAERVLHAFLSLIYYPAIDFYGSNIPMLSIFAAVFFLVGVGIAVVRTGRPGMLLLNGYFWALTLAIGIFSIPPSADSYRMLAVLPAALLMAAIAVDQILELIGLGWEKARAVYVFLAASLILVLAAFNLWTYYGDYLGQCKYGDNLTGRFASYLGKYARTVDRGSRIYLLSDDIYFYGSHSSVDFLSGVRPITNFPDPLDGLPAISGDTVIANPDRIAELEDWARVHPGGQLHYVYDCNNLILLSFEWP